jgi:hypothetical protein
MQPGVIHPTCDTIYGYQLELTKYRRHRLEKTIRFKTFGDLGLQMFPNKWLDELGMECGEADPCASFFSRIQVLHVSYYGGMLRLTGNFVIIFADHRKLEG